MRGRAHVIVVNDGYRLAPWADALVALDTDWWSVHWPRGVQDFRGLKFSCDPDVRDRYGARYVPCTIRDGLSTSWDQAYFGSDSGRFAIQIAVLMGATRIALLGFDCGWAPDGRKHFFGDHPEPLRNASPYELFREKYATVARSADELGVRIVNCSRETTLDCFPRARLRSVL